MLPAITGAVSFIRSAAEGLSQSSVSASATGASSIAASGVPSTDFLSMLGQVAGDGVQSLREGEAASISGLQGKAPVQQVVDTLLNAERNLQTAIAVRDKLVSSYQEISRMPI